MTDESTYEQKLARLGEAIAADGMGRHEVELAAVAARARRSRIAPAATEVMVDRNASGVLRERAYAVVCVALAAAAPFEPTGPVALTAA